MDKNTFIQTLLNNRERDLHSIPDKQLSETFVESLFQLLFHTSRYQQDTSNNLTTAYNNLYATCASLLFDVLHDEVSSELHTENFFKALPGIYELLLKDAEAILTFDPAATSLQEVYATYPGFFATAVYRLSHQLHKQKVPTLPRLLSEYAHSKTGIDIHPGATIGSSFFIDHGTGIVIGETTEIGNNVKIYQSVTLGALNVSKEQAKAKRHPVVGDNVIIYSGATILGGDTHIGHNSIIGGNVWLIHSVEPYSVVYQKSETIIRDKYTLPEALNYII